MRLPGRRREIPEADRIDAFWAWWREVSASFAEAVDSGRAATLAGPIGERVQEVHHALEWELSPGKQARHALVVTSGGVAEHRPLVERLVRAAPPASETWEFRPARAADPTVLDHTLRLDEHDLLLRDSRISIAVDDDRQLLDVVVHHPRFPEMTEDGRNRVAFLLLDWLLGEDGVERWLGSVSTTLRQPEDALPAEALTEIVEGLASRNADVTWALLEGEHRGHPVLILARRPLKWIEHPLLDRHLRVSVRYGERTAAGFPEPDTLERLRTWEDELIEALGERALLVAVETSNGTRVFHLYVDGTDAQVVETVEAWCRHRKGAALTSTIDPGWGAVRPFA